MTDSDRAKRVIKALRKEPINKPNVAIKKIIKYSIYLCHPRLLCHPRENGDPGFRGSRVPPEAGRQARDDNERGDNTTTVRKYTLHLLTTDHYCFDQPAIYNLATPA